MLGGKRLIRDFRFASPIPSRSIDRTAFLGKVLAGVGPRAYSGAGFSAMMMAGLDGIQRRLDPGQPLDKDIYALTLAELKEVPSMPASLEEALDHMKKDHEYLLKGTCSLRI